MAGPVHVVTVTEQKQGMTLTRQPNDPSKGVAGIHRYRILQLHSYFNNKSELSQIAEQT